MSGFSGRDAVIVGAVRTPIGKGKPNGALHDVLPVDLLAHSLRELVARTGIDPVQIEYRLTEKGMNLYPVLVAVWQWGDRYLADADGSPVEMAHRDCGAQVGAVLRCADGHELDSPREVVTRPGPGARRIARAG